MIYRRRYPALSTRPVGTQTFRPAPRPSSSTRVEFFDIHAGIRRDELLLRPMGAHSEFLSTSSIGRSSRKTACTWSGSLFSERYFEFKSVVCLALDQGYLDRFRG